MYLVKTSYFLSFHIYFKNRLLSDVNIILSVALIMNFLSLDNQERLSEIMMGVGSQEENWDKVMILKVTADFSVNSVLSHQQVDWNLSW